MTRYDHVTIDYITEYQGIKLLQPATPTFENLKG